MTASYIVRLKNNQVYCFYYIKNRGIYYRIFENGRWNKEVQLLSGAREGYTVTTDSNSVVYLFCQDFSGDIVLCNNKAGTWKNHVILRNQSDQTRTIQLNPIITATGISLIYNLPVSEENSNYIVMQSLDETGNWSAAQRIDKFFALSDSMFQMQRVFDEHHVLFYQTRTPENNLGYMEITPSQHGNFVPFHTTNYQIVDTSFLTTEQSIYVLYVVKNIFTCQLVFRKKESERFTKPIVLCEAQNMDKCMLFFVKNQMYASFMSSSQLFMCLSNDKGQSFTRAARYRNKFCLSPVKAIYLSETPLQVEEHFARQVYVDSDNLWDIQILPDLYEDFYPITTPTTSAEPTNSPDIPNIPDSEASDIIYRLQNQLEMSQKRNAEKDMQIMSLTAQLHSRAEELSLADAQKRELIRKLNEFSNQPSEPNNIDSN